MEEGVPGPAPSRSARFHEGLQLTRGQCALPRAGGRGVWQRGQGGAHTQPLPSQTCPEAQAFLFPVLRCLNRGRGSSPLELPGAGLLGRRLTSQGDKGGAEICHLLAPKLLLSAQMLTPDRPAPTAASPLTSHAQGPARRPLRRLEADRPFSASRLGSRETPLSLGSCLWHRPSPHPPLLEGKSVESRFRG